MPANYKYEHISSGRLKALNMAKSRVRSLHHDLIQSKVIAPSIIEQLRAIHALLGSASGTVDSEDVGLLESLLGKKMGEERH